MLPLVCHLLLAISPPLHRLNSARARLLRLQGGATDATFASAALSSAAPTTYSITLQDTVLHVVDNMYPSRLDDHPRVLEGLSADIVSATTSPTGGLFLHTGHDAAHEHTTSLGKLRCHRLKGSRQRHVALVIQIPGRPLRSSRRG